MFFVAQQVPSTRFDVMTTTCPHPAFGHLPPQAGEGKTGARET